MPNHRNGFKNSIRDIEVMKQYTDWDIFSVSVQIMFK